MSEQITLSQLAEQTSKIVEFVESFDYNFTLRFDFKDVGVSELDSYRGYYDELAVGFDIGGMGVQEFLIALIDAHGQTFYGYKGGDYIMHASTPVWVSNYGMCSDRIITGIEIVGEGRIEIKTKEELDE
jgi:hypothetical protein